MRPGKSDKEFAKRSVILQHATKTLELNTKREAQSLHKNTNLIFPSRNNILNNYSNIQPVEIMAGLAFLHHTLWSLFYWHQLTFPPKPPSIYLNEFNLNYTI